MADAAAILIKSINFCPTVPVHLFICFHFIKNRKSATRKKKRTLHGNVRAADAIVYTNVAELIIYPMVEKWNKKKKRTNQSTSLLCVFHVFSTILGSRFLCGCCCFCSHSYPHSHAVRFVYVWIFLTIDRCLGAFFVLS